MSSRLGAGLCWLLLVASPAVAIVVESVELVGDIDPSVAAGLMDLLAVAPGDELSGGALRKSLRNLQASGLVGRAEAARSPGRAASPPGRARPGSS